MLVEGENSVELLENLEIKVVMMNYDWVGICFERILMVFEKLLYE